MFFKETNTYLSKLEILESKLTMFEQMSKDMMQVLNDAVYKISEANQNVAKCLVSHDEKLRRTTDDQQRTFEKLEKLEKSNLLEHKELMLKIEKVEEKLEKNIEGNNKLINEKLAENDKFKSRLIGIGLVITVAVGLVAGITPIAIKAIDYYIEVRQEQFFNEYDAEDLNEDVLKRRREVLKSD